MTLNSNKISLWIFREKRRKCLQMWKMTQFTVTLVVKGKVFYLLLNSTEHRTVSLLPLLSVFRYDAIV